MPSVFDWDAHNTEHVSRHGIRPFEVEEAMADPDRVGSDVHDRGKKGIFGRTEDGRPLFVVYVLRDDAYRVITAKEETIMTMKPVNHPGLKAGACENRLLG